MTIDEAIELLEAEKAAGVKSVIVAWWQADMFGRADDKSWEHAADIVERKHDWSSTHEGLAMSLDLYTSE
jgi:hypothetical protein